MSTKRDIPFNSNKRVHEIAVDERKKGKGDAHLDSDLKL